MKRQIKLILSVVLAFTICFHTNMLNVNAKDIIADDVNYNVEIAEKEDVQTKTPSNTSEDEKTKGEERAEELSKMPLSGKSPMAYVGLIAVSVLVLGVMISVGKSAKKKDKFV